MNRIVATTAAVWMAVISATVASSAEIADLSSCHDQSESKGRLACYDEVSGRQPAVTPTPSVPAASDGKQWTYSDEMSALDGRKDVWLRLASLNYQPDQIGNNERARLWVRCMSNKTNVLIEFNDYTTDDQNVRYRLDDGKPRKVWMETMRGGDGIGIWSGRRAIPFTKAIFGKAKLVIAYESYSNLNLEFEFNISGLRARIEPLAEACNWKP